MKAIIAALALALFCVNAQGQVLIYKNKIGLTTTGGGATSKGKITGFAVVKATNGAVTRIEAYPASKNFRVFNIGYTVNTVRGTQGKEYLVFSYVDFYYDANNNQVEDSETVKGMTVTTDIGDVHSWSIPRTMQLVGRTIYTSSGQPMIDELAGTLVYDAKSTQSANLQVQTFDEAVSQIKTSLLGQGYTQL